MIFPLMPALANSSKPPVLHHGATRFPLSKHRHPSQGHPKQSQHRWWWGTQTHYKWRKSAWSKHGHDSNQDWNQRHDKKSDRMLVWQGSCVWGWSSFGCSPVSWHFPGRLRTRHHHTSNRLKACLWEMIFFAPIPFKYLLQLSHSKSLSLRCFLCNPSWQSPVQLCVSRV